MSGEELKAKRIVSNLDPRRTHLDLLDPIHLSPELQQWVRNIRFKGVCTWVNLALAELPSFKGVANGDTHLHGAISIGPSFDYLERAYNDAKYGAPLQQLFLEAVISSLTDPELAPNGKHIMSILVQYAPYQLKDGIWNDT